MIRFAVDNPLLTNLSLVVVVVLGVLSWYAMPQEMFPVVELDMARITTLFEGAAPEEVERQVTVPIEQAFDGMPDIDTLTSTSDEGRSSVLIRLKAGTNVDDFMREAQTALDQVTDLPDEAERPELARLETRFPVISVSLYGDVARGYLNDLADRVKERLQELPGVAGVGMAGDRDWELWVEVDPQRLAAMQVSLSEIASALRANLRDLPGGSIEAREGDILLRGKGVAPAPAAVGAIPVRTNERGGQLALSQVADIGLRLEEPATLGRFNGKPAVNLTITKTAQASTIEVSNRVRTLIGSLRSELPAGVQAGLFSDLSVYVKNRLNTVKSSGLLGLALLLFSLYLFLNFRVAAITAMGIPVSVMVGVAALHWLGYTINMVSLFAFLIALGLIVDDAIIVTENVYRHMEEGATPRDAALKGTREVLWPVVAATTTTIAAFIPMFAIGGTLGAFIQVIPVVVSATLLGSLAEAFGVLPSHARHMLRVQRHPHRTGRIDWGVLLQRYLAVLRWSVCHRYFVAGLAIGVLAVAAAWAGTRLQFQLFGHVDVGQFFINAEAPNTYSLEDTARLAGRMEAVVLESVHEDELDSLLTNVGVTLIDFNRSRMGSHYIQLIVDLAPRRPQGFIERFITPLVSLDFGPVGGRERATEDIIQVLRDRLVQLPGLKRMSILRPQGGPAGADVEIGIQGDELGRLRAEASEVAAFLRQLPGVHDVRRDLDVGKIEYRYHINERGRVLGLTQQQLAEAVRTGFLGSEVVHVTHRDERIPVRLIYTRDARHDADLADLPVVLAGGRTVWLGQVADIETGRALDTIQRRDGRRLATVSAEVDSEMITVQEVSELVRRQFPALQVPGGAYRMLFLGEKREAAESIADALRALAIALMVIFFILTALFRSLLDPLVVMFAIPFGMIGVIVGHVLFDFNIQFLTLVGFLALTGIVVNDSLILVDFANRRRAAGSEPVEATVEAGRVRVRPILLTSLTTFLGISPLIFFATGQTAFLSPMAVSLGFGLLFATVLILICVPCFYLIADDLRAWVRARVRHEARTA